MSSSGIAISFELWPRDTLLVYFFTTIGINASLKDLLAGGKPLVILLVITIPYMSLQNIVRDFRGLVVRFAGGRRDARRDRVPDRWPWDRRSRGRHGSPKPTGSPTPWKSGWPVRRSD